MFDIGRSCRTGTPFSHSELELNLVGCFQKGAASAALFLMSKGAVSLRIMFDSS